LFDTTKTGSFKLSVKKPKGGSSNGWVDMGKVSVKSDLGTLDLGAANIVGIDALDHGGVVAERVVKTFKVHELADGAITVSRDKLGHGGSLMSAGSIHVGGTLGKITANGGDINVSLTAGGQVAGIAAVMGKDGQGGNVTGTFILGGGPRLIEARGGDLNLARLEVAAGGVADNRGRDSRGRGLHVEVDRAHR